MAGAAEEAKRKRMEDSHAHLVDPDDNLRKVEIDVVIPKMMKKEAIKRCDTVVKQFTECCKGRTISIMWACREANEALDVCLRNNLTDDDFLREKKNFIKLRAEHNAAQAADPQKGPATTTSKVGAL
eukprot:m.165095 g.165095  ORF g.165095 m.165095 type:complete len:127 (-) comp12511_c0_seq1:148-528(-)